MTRYGRFINYSYCVGGRHHSSTINIKPAITFNQKLEEISFFKGIVVYVKELKQIVSDNYD